MKSELDSYFLELTDKLAFLQIEEGSLNGFGKIPDDFVIPILVNDIKEQAADAEGFSTQQIVSAILYILGIDPLFKHKEEYLAFLNNAIDHPEAFAADLAMKKYDVKSYLDALVYFRAAMLLKDDVIFPFFNYAQIALEFSLATNDKELEKKLVVEAERLFDEVLKREALEPLANFQKGLLLRDRDELAQALPYFEKAATYGDDEVKEKANLLIRDIRMYQRLAEAETWIGQGEYERSLAVLESESEEGLVLELRYQIYFARGFCYKALGQFEKAIEIYSKALEINNQDTLLLAELGVCYAYEGEYEQALEFYLAALELEKDSVELMNNIAILYLQQKDFVKAKEYIGYAKELAPHDEIVDATILKIRKIEEETQWTN